MRILAISPQRGSLHATLPFLLHGEIWSDFDPSKENNQGFFLEICGPYPPRLRLRYYKLTK